eukprot:1146114-Pelagomonas_calceolata.AAC.4
MDIGLALPVLISMKTTNSKESSPNLSVKNEKKSMRITWEPSWEPEDTKGTWPNSLQRILEFETHKD